MRLNDLRPETRLDMIEETRWQYGQEHTGLCILDNALISEMCDWSKTRQGHMYWSLISGLMPAEMN